MHVPLNAQKQLHFFEGTYDMQASNAHTHIFIRSYTSRSHLIPFKRYSYHQSLFESHLRTRKRPRSKMRFITP